MADNEIDLDAIEARANAATAGPWSAEDCDVWTQAEHIFGGTVHTVDDRYPRSGYNPAEDAEFIAHARQDVPALLAEVRRLRAEAEGALRGATAEGELGTYSRDYGEFAARMNAAPPEWRDEWHRQYQAYAQRRADCRDLDHVGRIAHLEATVADLRGSESHA